LTRGFSNAGLVPMFFFFLLTILALSSLLLNLGADFVRCFVLLVRASSCLFTGNHGTIFFPQPFFFFPLLLGGLRPCCNFPFTFFETLFSFAVFLGLKVFSIFHDSTEDPRLRLLMFSSRNFWARLFFFFFFGEANRVLSFFRCCHRVFLDSFVSLISWHTGLPCNWRQRSFLWLRRGPSPSPSLGYWSHFFSSGPHTERF